MVVQARVFRLSEKGPLIKKDNRAPLMLLGADRMT
jgi:hypothetical protein